jgi:hypothetical protein
MEGPFGIWKDFSGVLLYSLAPIKPADDKPRRLTTAERAQFTLSSEIKDILIGLY